MNIETVASSFLSAIVGGIIVAIVSHFLTKKREYQKKISETRLEYLVDSWLKIEKAALSPIDATADELNESRRNFDSAYAKVLLLGTKSEIEAANKCGDGLSSGDPEAIHFLLNSLRRSLRKEIGLEDVSGLKTFFRLRRISSNKIDTR